MNNQPNAKKNDVPAVCPMAALKGCNRCPIYKVCLPKYVIGDEPLPTRTPKRVD
ncbi:hypothetical protein [Ferrimonas lipolytica]|uniref:Uncharacterized protein n=1 Tax=Ferrimonas lipolytica TaxID=2724191 RepID=A0A6H1UAA1_9GAMM|nr:hypothetical protein [Ferrimonas lipolytica]QIZ75985.1 hypothetical protein HER31_03255 [Ferrimonas lipolytica]